MIARVWQGWAPLATADGYQRHYESDVAAHLAQTPGFLGGRLLRMRDGGEIRFTSITFFTDLAAIKAFAGHEYELAVLEDEARSTLARWDDRVTHHDVAVELPRPV